MIQLSNSAKARTVVIDMDTMTGVVLAERVGHTHEPFVTWGMAYDEDDDRWECTGGHYFPTLDQAHDDFRLRILTVNKPEGATVKVAQQRLSRVDGCVSCERGHGPMHDASDRCRSGKRPHCSCDTCF